MRSVGVVGEEEEVSKEVVFSSDSSDGIISSSGILSITRRKAWTIVASVQVPSHLDRETSMRVCWGCVASIEGCDRRRHSLCG